MPQVLAVIMAGGAGTRLSVLSEERSKPAVPFAGRYRIIDFALSNCVNSDIFNVAVLTQYRPHSLNEHIGIGKPWDLDRAGIHERVGRLTVNDLLHEWVHHDRAHLKQILGNVQAYVWPEMGGAQAFVE